MISLRLVLVSAVLLFATSSGVSAADPVRVRVEKKIPAPDGIGSPSVFLKNYEVFRSNQLRSINPNLLVISLGQFKDHARSFRSAAGSVSIDLKSGRYTITLTGLTAGSTYSVWLINEDEAEDAPDRPLLLTSVLAAGSTATATGQLSAAASQSSLDSIVITAGPRSVENIVASGSTSVLQKIFFGSVQLTIGGTRVSDGALATRQLPFSSLIPEVVLETPESAGSARAQGTAALLGPILSGPVTSTPIDALIKKGSKLFFEGTFKGNGRTCGTCHPAHNNLTIDPAFISTLPNTDPLFIAETNPVLAGLEKPALMRAFGLILENLDGLDAPTTKFVMRSVPHTLGMTVTLIQDTAQVPTPAQMTGWGGDGAPGAGSLRDFATGAVTQHFTKRLARVPGVDFKLPKQNQLDAMEAFQLSLGRTADFNLTKLLFLDPAVETGKLIFLNGTGDPAAGGRCNVCHGNAGAIAEFVPPTIPRNRNFNSNVEDRPNPARVVQTFPIDAGFGLTPNADGSFGNRTFNAPSLIEAADTPPFFHNNVIGTLEAAVNFYTGPEFSAPRAPAARFIFTAAQTTQVANFLRGINTLQNLDVARRELNEIVTLSLASNSEIQSRLSTAFNETGDVIQVLSEGNIFPLALVQATTARQLIVQAQSAATPALRLPFITLAGTTIDAARGLVATVVP